MPKTPSDIISTRASAQKSGALKGVVTAPGDKSISHRSIILGTLAEGTTEVTGLLEGADILSTIAVMQALGGKISRQGVGHWHVTGVGAKGLKTSQDDLDCGNAGTGVRLIMGAVAGQGVKARFVGDSSLSARPMGRVLDPLGDMGVVSESQDGGRLPVTLHAGTVQPLDYTPPHASAQVKSCILLAGLGAKGVTTVREPRLTRDHSENMLRAFGVRVDSQIIGAGQHVRLTGPAHLTACRIRVPGDPSSAAFPIVAALIVPGSDVIIENVMMNKTRTGLFETLIEMGAYLRADNFRTSGGEVIADIHVKHSQLRGISVPPQRAASMIDEYPILTIAAAAARGTTIMDGIGELRVKESDRIAATAALLRENGVNVAEREDGMSVIGGPVHGGAVVKTHHDHRIAMSALILGLIANKPITIDDAAMIGTSFPSFFAVMDRMGASLTQA